MLHQGFTRVRLSNSYMPRFSSAFTVTFTTATFRTEAAYGCLKSVPTNRLRRANLHLEYSIGLFEHVLGTNHPGSGYALEYMNYRPMVEVQVT